MVFAHLSRECVSAYLKKFINKRGHETLKEREGAMVEILMKSLYNRVGTKEGDPERNIRKVERNKGNGKEVRLS